MNMQRILATLLVVAPLALLAQKYGTRNAAITFHSETPLETIEADNRKATCVIDAATGAIEFMVLIKGFEFEKALMQEHFNENYMESNKFPKAQFAGKLKGISAEQFTTPGTYPVDVEGDLTIHGVTKPLETKATITVEPTGAIKAIGHFQVDPEDHAISIPGMVRDNIAKQLDVKIDAGLQKL